MITWRFSATSQKTIPTKHDLSSAKVWVLLRPRYLLLEEKVRRYRARFCRCRILLGHFYQELHSVHTPPWGSGCLFSWVFCYSASGSKPSPESLHSHTNSSLANNSNVITGTGCNIEVWGFFSGICCTYNVTILRFVSLFHCNEAKTFQQFH